MYEVLLCFVVFEEGIDFGEAEELAVDFDLVVACVFGDGDDGAYGVAVVMESLDGQVDVYHGRTSCHVRC